MASFSLKTSYIRLKRGDMTFTEKPSFNIQYFRNFSSSLFITSLHYSLKSHDVIFTFMGTKISWKEASQLCKEVGGYLPYFTSRHHVEQLLALFKLSEAIPPIAQIFIGLRSNTSKVSFFSSFAL